MPAPSWPRCWSACSPSATKLAALSAPQMPKMPHSSRNLSSSNGLVVSNLWTSRWCCGAYRDVGALCRHLPEPKVDSLMHNVRMFGVLLALGTAGCSSEPQEVAETWRNGRDGLCLAGEE